MRLQEKNGYILYRREKTKFKNTAPIPKYYIVKDDGKTYYKDFARLPSAKKTFRELTDQPAQVEVTPKTLPETLTVSEGFMGIVSEKGLTVCRVYGYIKRDGGMQDTDILEANAKELVRRYNAFPGMLEALKGFIHSVEHEGVINGRVVDAVENAKAAIQSATK